MTEVHITAVEGNSQRLDGGAMFGNAPKAVWESWIAPDDKSRIPLQCRSMLLEIGRHRVLCEVGIGAFFEPKLADRFGVVESTHKLIENLSKINISTSDIDFVILSHLHFDHAGGLLPSWSEQKLGQNELHFPNAKYVVGAKAFERAQNPHPRDRASFITGLTDQLLKSNRLILVNDHDHKDILPDHLSFIFTDGHTPGHMHTVAKHKDQTLVFAGDLIPGRAWVHLPITMGYDRFAEQVIDEKKSFYDRFANSKSWIFYTHDHEVAMSQVKQDEKGRFVSYNEKRDPFKFHL